MRRGLAALGAACCASLVVGVASAARAGDGWTQVMQDQKMTVWQRQVPGGRVKEVKAAGVIDAPPAAVYAVLKDLEHYKDIMPYTVESRVLGAEPDGKTAYFYTVVDAPVVSKRDYSLKISVDRLPKDNDGVYRVSWVAANDYPKAPAPREGFVRLSTVNGSWDLKPFSDGKTFAVYFVNTDPGGSIPTFLIDRGNTEAVPKVFEALRKWAKQAPYSLAK